MTEYGVIWRGEWDDEDRCGICSEYLSYCDGHRPDEPPHHEICSMCADLRRAVEVIE